MDKVLIPTASNHNATVNAKFSAPGPGALRFLINVELLNNMLAITHTSNK